MDAGHIEAVAYHGDARDRATDHLLTWDIPDLDEYSTYKADVFLLIEPGWAPFFEDAAPGQNSLIDWRILSWGGVPIDVRPLGDIDHARSGSI